MSQTKQKHQRESDNIENQMIYSPLLQHWQWDLFPVHESKWPTTPYHQPATQWAQISSSNEWLLCPVKILYKLYLFLQNKKTDF